MRVLHCTHTYPPPVNGVSVVTALAVNGLLTRGVNVGLVTPEYPPLAQTVFGTTLAPTASLALPAVDFPPYPGVRMVWRGRRQMEAFARAFHPDLVHADTEFVVGWYGAHIARALGVPLVTSFHTDFAKYAESYGLAALRTPVTQLLVRFHRKAARIYTPSSVTADWLGAHALRQVEVWGRAVDTDVFHPARRSHTWRERLGLGDKVVLLHVGRLAAEKNVHVLLQGFAHVRRRLGDQAALVIAGDGPAAKVLRAAAPPGVHFVGFIDRQRDLPALYASADVFVGASTTETFGLVILEAMASGLPVVAVAAGGVADHLRHFDNGLAAAPRAECFASAMEELITKPALRARLGAAARAWAVALGWERELDRLVESYRDVCETAGSVSPSHAREAAA
jgi:phosphatidylinositol alpha 1,6-mannosyltransferase